MTQNAQIIFRRGLGFALAAVALFWGGPGVAELRAGVARISINPVEEDLPTQLGGYRERAGAPALGTHDTICAKALVFEHDGARSAPVTRD